MENTWAARLMLLQVLFWTVTTFDGENGSGVVQVVVEEGQNAILPCSRRTKQDITDVLFDWRTENPQLEVFLYNSRSHYKNGLPGQDKQFKERVAHFPDELKFGNASIKITDVTMADSGNYTCAFPRLQPPEVSRVLLIVDRAMLKDKSEESTGAAKPCISIVNASEDGVLLKCEVRGASSRPELAWQDSHGDGLAVGDSNIRERGGSFHAVLFTTVKLTSTHRFRCICRQEDIGHIGHEELFVPGALSRPRIRILDATKDGVQLKCEVEDAFPVPELEWLDSDGKVLPAEDPQIAQSGGLFSVSRITTVTKTSTNLFRCVAKQPTISRETDDDVRVPEKMFENCNMWISIVAFLVVVVLGVCATAVIIYRRKPCKKGEEERAKNNKLLNSAQHPSTSTEYTDKTFEQLILPERAAACSSAGS